MSNNTLETLQSKLGADRVKENKDLTLLTTMKSKTIAQYFYEAESREDLENVVKVAHELSLPLFILGGGSNLAITKEIIEGIVVKNFYQKKEVISETDTFVNLMVSSGYRVGRLVMETAKAGYEGLEYQMGLPGTLGGALYTNSKWTHPLTYFGDNLISAELIDKSGNIKKVERSYFNFAYDYSILQQTKEIVLDTVYRLKKADPSILVKKAQESLAYRKETQPVGVNTSGCFFQNVSEEVQQEHNLDTRSAGALIDRTGLKGTKIGDFIISDRHANFIINQGQGKPEDLKKMLDLVKTKVKEKYNIELKEEVVVI